MKVEATLIIFDDVVDTQGDVFDPRGVQFRAKVSVSRNGLKSAQDILAIGDLFQKDNALKLRFDLPTKKLPDFPLYASVEGKILEAGEQNGARLIKKCQIDWVNISTEPNSDPRCGRLEAADE